MDTIEDTLTNEAYARILHNLPPDSGDLLLPNEAERIWKGFVDYHSYPNPFDCIENDTELMDGFFGIFIPLRLFRMARRSGFESGTC